ncbi:AAA family ATPase [Streptomyces boninensis]|uniref:AAA family ATPase n=1 Tax=Streptomyces boninensis TaxID=2039455 RepID=UPI003B228ED6
MTHFHGAKEWDRLERRVERCAGGEPAIVLLEGPPGCGKTELLLDLAHHAAGRGAVVLHAAGSAADQDTPHALVRGLLSEMPAGEAGENSSRRLRPAPEFTRAICSLAAGSFVMLGVDDVHYADGPSLGYLLHLCRRLRQAAVLLVFTLTPGVPGPGSRPEVITELLRHEGFTRITLGRLGERGTAAVAARELSGRPAAATTRRLLRTTGGNPLLLKALLSEERARPEPGRGAAPRRPEPAPGGPFHQAVATCLARCGPEAGQLAAAMAVLSEDATAEQAATVAGLDPAAAERAFALLTASGLTDGRRLRHPAVATAALDGTDTAGIARLHLRAARVRHDHGARPGVVADHLLPARTTAARAEPGGWTVAVLNEAARQALLDDDGGYAISCLDLARELCGTTADRVAVELRLAGLAGRTDPAAAERYLKGPVAALRGGQLGGRSAAVLARLLLTHGAIVPATEAGGYAEREREQSEADDPPHGLLGLPAPARPPAAGGLPAARVMWPDAATGAEEHAIERLLKDTPLTHSTFDMMLQAIRALIHADCADRALVWCQKLKAEADRGGSPGWYAAVGLQHAKVLLRTGDLRSAAHEAAAAAEAVGARAGLLQYGLVAAEVTALTAMGSHEAAARSLELPAPDELYTTSYALDYLRSRGLHYAGTRRPRAALAEFAEAGRLARRWGLDTPQQLPWRTDAAAVLAELGEHRRAERLVEEQLALPDGRTPRVRGVSLRVRAMLAPPGERSPLLQSAMTELRRCGDRLEHARALADLVQALQLTGEGQRAGSVARRAWQLAADCGAQALCDRILPERRAAAGDGWPRASGSGRAGLLTRAERQVAALAAVGHSNREISAKLYVTIGTVEQHLSRAYRKLGVSGRGELPVDLHQGEAAEADQPEDSISPGGSSPSA